MHRPRLIPACLVGLVSMALEAQSPAPITLAVDASDAPRRIFHVHESMSAPPGVLTLAYPKWIPGEHGPTGPITDLVGLKVTSGGHAIEWKRVPTDMWSFTLDIPAGAAPLDIAFDYVAPLTSWTSASSQLMVINWWPVVLYPKGPQSNDTLFSPRLKVPAGWKTGTALPIERESGESLVFSPVSLVTLIDSPVLAGAHVNTVELTPGEKPGHWLHIAGDSAASVEITPEDVAHYKRLVAEALALFGARHYANYHFLLTLSDHIPFNGLEHHESSDNRTAERAFLDENARRVLGTLLSHEYVHSWNGKYRTPGRPRLRSHGGLSGAARHRFALGLRRAHGILRRRPRRPKRPALARAVPREPRVARRHHGPPGGPSLAAAGRHGRGRAAPVFREAGVGGLAPRRRLLPRERADLAGGRHADPPEDGRKEVARRFRARVSRSPGRHARGQDVQVRGRRRRAQRRGSLRVGGLSARPDLEGRPARAAGRDPERRMEARLLRRQAGADEGDGGDRPPLRLSGSRSA